MEWGARDPTSSELESNFSDKVLGNWDTSHVIRGPAGMDKIVGLHTRECAPLPAGTPPMPWLEATKNRNQVPGWRLEDDGDEAATALVREWRARDGAAATALAARLAEAAAAAGHPPASLAADEAGATVTARLATAGLAGGPGSLSVNDFILAAKLNRVATGDLEKKAKPKFWA